MTTTPEKKPIIHIQLSPPLARRITNYQHRHKFATRLAAVRHLLELGLATGRKPAKQGKAV